MHRPLTACAALFLAGGVAAPQPTFRASTRLVEVGVVVEDGSGRPVEGLSRSDFTVSEDGVEVPIEIFAAPPARGNTAAPAAGASRRDAVATPREPLTRGDFSNRLGDAVPGVTVVVLDRLNTRFEDQRSQRDDLLKAVAQIRPDDRTALDVIESDVVRVLHDFTADTASLQRALSRYQARTSRQTQATTATSRPSRRTCNWRSPTSSARKCGAMACASRAPSPSARASAVCTSSSATGRPGRRDR